MDDTGTRPHALTESLIGDMTDEEIQEWKNSRGGVPGMYFAGATAEDIRQGKFSPGQEIYKMEVREWLFRGADGMSPKTFENAMNMLIEKKMVQVVKKKSGRIWEKFYYVAGGEPLS
jgi:hypothetical protein